MSIMGIIWPYFLNKNPTKWFIHASSWFHGFPHTMSPVDSSSSKSCQIFHQFWGFVPKLSYVYRKYIQGIFNPRNLFFSLFLNLPLNSSPCFNMKNNEFHKKTCSNLVFGDDFTSAGTKWVYHNFFYVLRLKCQSKEVKIMR